jgi:hypothetical protein
VIAAAVAATISVAAATASPNLANQTIKLGSTYIITGETSLPSRSRVTLQGSWDRGPWRLIVAARTTEPHGRYRVVVRPTRRGELRLRLQTPGHVYSVVITVV